MQGQKIALQLSKVLSFPAAATAAFNCQKAGKQQIRKVLSENRDKENRDKTSIWQEAM